jgi:hypothetical protein
MIPNPLWRGHNRLWSPAARQSPTRGSDSCLHSASSKPHPNCWLPPYENWPDKFLKASRSLASQSLMSRRLGNNWRPLTLRFRCGPWRFPLPPHVLTNIFRFNRDVRFVPIADMHYVIRDRRNRANPPAALKGVGGTQASCSIVTATSPFAERRTLLPSTSATRLPSM